MFIYSNSLGARFAVLGRKILHLGTFFAKYIMFVSLRIWKWRDKASNFVPLGMTFASLTKVET